MRIALVGINDLEQLDSVSTEDRNSIVQK